MKLEQIKKFITEERMLEIFRNYVKTPFTCRFGKKKKYPDIEWLIVKKNRKKVCEMNMTNLINETIQSFVEKTRDSMKPLNEERMNLLFLEAFNDAMNVKLAPLLAIMEIVDTNWDDNKFKELIAKKMKELKVNAKFRISTIEENINEKKWEEVDGETGN